MEAFRADPENNPLSTPSGKIELFSARIAEAQLADCRGHASWFAPRESRAIGANKEGSLHLISSQPKGRLHSQYDNGLTSQREKIHEREKIRMNPADAAARGIRNGQIVRVFNDRGASLAGVEVSDKVMVGVVQLPVGAWYDPLEPGVVDSLDKHGNPNVLTRDAGTSALAQGPSAMSCLVEVELWTKPMPPITAFGGPTLTGRENAQRV
jgi:biotin/methionine sulfoxide reductase